MRASRAFVAAGVLILAFAMAFGAKGESTASFFVAAEGPAIVRARAAALLMSGQEGGNLALEMLAVPFSEGDLRSNVVVVTELSGPELLRGADSSELPVEVFVYGLGSKQIVQAQASLAFRLDLDQHRSLLGSTGLKVVTTLRLLPGEHLIRVLARTAAGGFGARSHSITVPQPGAPRASVALVEEEDAWLVVTDPSMGDGGEAPYPLSWGGHRRVPAVVARLRGEGPWNAWTIAGGMPETQELTARFRELSDSYSSPSSQASRDEQTVEFPVAITEQATLIDERALRFRIDNPGLIPGRYELKVVARSEEAADLESPGLRVRFEAGEGGEGGALQIAEGKGAESGRGPSGRAKRGSRKKTGARTKKSLPKEGSRKRAQDLAPYVAGYQRVLAVVGKGDQRAVGRTLARFVRKTWKEREEDAPTVLGEALALLLEKKSGEGKDPWPMMMPVIQAHLDLAGRGLQEGKYSLAQYASRTALDLARARATVLGTEAAAQEAAAVTTCLAMAYLETGSRGLARVLLERALDLHGEQEAALLLRAAVQEKEGRYSEAADTLRRLVEAHPKHDEGRLRLAMQELRLRQSSRARRRFETLLEGEAPPWVQLLAVQELARLHRQAGRRGQAEAVLTKATERWPDNARLKTLRAQLLDDQQSYVLSRFLVARESEVPRQLSEREIYNRWPEAPVRRLELELRSAAEEVLSLAREGSSALAGAAR